MQKSRNALAIALAVMQMISGCSPLSAAPTKGATDAPLPTIASVGETPFATVTTTLTGQATEDSSPQITPTVVEQTGSLTLAVGYATSEFAGSICGGDRPQGQIFLGEYPFESMGQLSPVDGSDYFDPEANPTRRQVAAIRIRRNIEGVKGAESANSTDLEYEDSDSIVILKPNQEPEVLPGTAVTRIENTDVENRCTVSQGINSLVGWVDANTLLYTTIVDGRQQLIVFNTAADSTSLVDENATSASISSDHPWFGFWSVDARVITLRGVGQSGLIMGEAFSLPPEATTEAYPSILNWVSLDEMIVGIRERSSLAMYRLQVATGTWQLLASFSDALPRASWPGTHEVFMCVDRGQKRGIMAFSLVQLQTEWIHEISTIQCVNSRVIVNPSGERSFGAIDSSAPNRVITGSIGADAETRYLDIQLPNLPGFGIVAFSTVNWGPNTPQ